MLLRNKLAIVTGASSGIGKACAKIFVAEGAKVVATGRSRDALLALQDEVGCNVIVSDLTGGGVNDFVKEAVGVLGGLTTVVNCAGVLKPGAFGSDATDLDNYGMDAVSN
jgi:NADP-dependent 3-hydroxy acid dehydrogenase YdfG